MEKVKVRVSVPEELRETLDKLATQLHFTNSLTRIANAVEYALVRGLPRVKHIFQPPTNQRGHRDYVYPTVPADVARKLDALAEHHKLQGVASVGYTALVLGLESLEVDNG
jgi:predicted transcriptional regulator